MIAFSVPMFTATRLVSPAVPVMIVPIDVNLREFWMSGWREGRGDQWSGMTGVSGIHKNPMVLS